jgi:hypothetical protein
MLQGAIEALKDNNTTAALKAFNDEKNREFHDRDLYVFCFSLLDGNFTAYANVRELKLKKDPIGQRAYDVVVAAAPEEQFFAIDYNFSKPGTKQAATKQSLEAQIGNQAWGVSYFK